MKKISCLIMIAVILGSCACGNNRKKSAESETGNNSTDQMVDADIPLVALETGEFIYKESDFGPIIELKGVSIETDDIFKPEGIETIIRDTILIMESRSANTMFRIYSFPQLKFIKELGTVGRGPNEFMFPTLIPTKDKEALCYVFEGTNKKIYKLAKDLNLYPLETSTPDKYLNERTEKQFSALNENNILFSNYTQVYHYINDSTAIDPVKEIIDLRYLKGHKFWGAYIGSFGVNDAFNRFVYAYKYDKRLVFGDLEGNTRIIKFKQDQAGFAQSLDENVTNYWKLYPCKNYVYISYSGRKPVEAYRDNTNGDRYIYIEKFDWNGNPVSKYKLDKWGYFMVDEQNNKLYIISALDEFPFIEYNL